MGEGSHSVFSKVVMEGMVDFWVGMPLEASLPYHRLVCHFHHLPGLSHFQSALLGQSPLCDFGAWKIPKLGPLPVSTSLQLLSTRLKYTSPLATASYVSYVDIWTPHTFLTPFPSLCKVRVLKPETWDLPQPLFLKVQLKLFRHWLLGKANYAKMWAPSAPGYLVN